MGLDLYCDGIELYIHIPYSYFFRIREVIADAIDLPIHFMEGFLDVSDNKIHFGHHIEDIKDIYRIGVPIKWNMLRYEPLHNIINHSDCEGTLSWRIAGRIAKRLKEIKDKIKFKEFNISEEIYENFIKLLESSHKNKKRINFG